MTEWREYERRPEVREARRVEQKTYVETNHGEAVAEPGDYIVRGPDGEKWPVSGERFDDLYAPAESMVAGKDVGEVYEDRNQLALAFIMEYARLYEGDRVGWYEHDEWAVLYAELPTGLVSWHVRPEVVPDHLPKRSADVFDGHTRAEKNARLRAYANGEA